MFRKPIKGLYLLSNPKFARGMVFYGVPAAIEHSRILKFIRPRHVIDVGANKGQFALATYAVNPDVKIDCFEPFPKSALKLERWARNTSASIQVHRLALSAESGTAEFHVTTREDSSSLFRPAAPQVEMGIRTKDIIVVPIERLDRVFGGNEVLRPSLLKIDVQGGELGVLQGVGRLSQVIDYVYLEVSFLELYEKQPLFQETDAYLRSQGYLLRGITNAQIDNAFGPTQADALYVKERSKRY